MDCNFESINVKLIPLVLLHNDKNKIKNHLSNIFTSKKQKIQSDNFSFLLRSSSFSFLDFSKKVAMMTETCLKLYLSDSRDRHRGISFSFPYERWRRVANI